MTEEFQERIEEIRKSGRRHRAMDLMLAIGGFSLFVALVVLEILGIVSELGTVISLAGLMLGVFGMLDRNLQRQHELLLAENIRQSAVLGDIRKIIK